MKTIRTCFCLLVVFTLVKYNQCGRYGGGGRSSGGSRVSSSSYGRGSSSRGSSYGSSYGSRPATSRPVYHAPTARRAPATSRPFTTARTYQSYPRSTARSVTQPTSYRQYTTPRHNTMQRQTSRPVNQATQRSHDTMGRQTSRPLNNQPYRTTPRPNIRQTTPRGIYTTRAGGWVLPTRPVQQRQQYSQLGSSQGGGYPHTYTGYHGPSKVKIVNKYQYNYPGYYSLPVQSSYPGYYHAPSYYSYRSSDTGSTALGFFLGYGLGRLTTPTYSHYSFYDGYTPRYDHYTVHHYYHNRESIPPKQEIPSNTIVGCVGDSSTVCPSNTVSLCTNSGALMCVVTATATTPCENNLKERCVKSEIPCLNSSAPECQHATQNKTTVSIPCISEAEVNGDIKFVDNTIIVDMPANITSNSTDGNSTTPSTVEWSTKYPITTTPNPQTSTVTISSAAQTKAQNFCVTVVALPAKKKNTQGEKLLDDAKDIASTFMESVWGL